VQYVREEVQASHLHGHGCFFYQQGTLEDIADLIGRGGEGRGREGRREIDEEGKGRGEGGRRE
jgi:hypothetical protein